VDLGDGRSRINGSRGPKSIELGLVAALNTALRPCSCTSFDPGLSFVKTLSDLIKEDATDRKLKLLVSGFLGRFSSTGCDN
jgi:hypothetical protein